MSLCRQCEPGLNDFTLTVKETPEIIAISETKLQDENTYKISIPGYVFLNTNSPTRAEGVGLYISKELTFIRRRDLEITEDGIESSWVEIMREKEKNCNWFYSHSCLCREIPECVGYVTLIVEC